MQHPAPLHIVLYQPEIPPNTGNVARLCACTGAQLHLIHPLGFSIDNKQLKRAGLDYWPYLHVQEHADWQAFRHFAAGKRIFGLSSKATKSVWDIRFKAGDVLLFGPETRGLPADILAEVEAITIPMRDDAPVRSLNLSSACAVAAYEALRQIGGRG
ncbi:MAG TPA: tRNA (cytidine(34)-2'-O)-methyltransferase [Mariprofundaceae bacterium]|nr:tRNA (cytidine(34)-2'-O)-methyltransferase [Mariprofundaceae bacterium]